MPSSSPAPSAPSFPRSAGLPAFLALALALSHWGRAEAAPSPAPQEDTSRTALGSPRILRSPGASVPAFRVGRSDAVLAAAATGLQAWAQYRYVSMEPAGPDRLRRRDLWAMDRWAAGNHSASAALASDILIFPGVALPMALSAWDARRAGSWAPLLTEAVVYAEALAISSSLNLLVRSLGVHSRPLVYGSDAPESERLKGEASGSFYSGHANASFLAAVYLSYTYPLRHPDFGHKAWLWAGSLAAAGSVAALRVSAGKHFPSDVAVGAMTGAFFGWLFPRMHLSPAGKAAAGREGRPGRASGFRRAELRFLPAGGIGAEDSGIHPAVVFRF